MNIKCHEWSRGRNQSKLRKKCPVVTLCNTDPTYIVPGLNPYFSNGIPCDLKCGMALCIKSWVIKRNFHILSGSISWIFSLHFLSQETGNTSFCKFPEPLFDGLNKCSEATVLKWRLKVIHISVTTERTDIS